MSIKKQVKIDEKFYEDIEDYMLFNDISFNSLVNNALKYYIENDCFLDGAIPFGDDGLLIEESLNMIEPAYAVMFDDSGNMFSLNSITCDLDKIYHIRENDDGNY